jgi:hypothetical protein
VPLLDPVGRFLRTALGIGSSETLHSGAKLQDAYLEQLDVMLQWFDEAEHCALKGWPDFRADLHSAFELQRLGTKRAILRLKYLRKCAPVRLDAVKSLSELSHITNDGFTEEQDASAAREMVDYSPIQAEIIRLTAMAPLAVDGPFAALEKDPEWHRLRENLSRNLQAVEASVARKG